MLSLCRCGCPWSEGPHTTQNAAIVPLTKLAKIETFAEVDADTVCPGEVGCALLSSLPLFTDAQFNFLNPKVGLPKHHNTTWL